MNHARRIAGLLVCAGTVIGLGSPAFAGEWNKGNFDEEGGNIPGKDHARSECVFNGQDEPDEPEPGAGGGEPWFRPFPGADLMSDDVMWSTTPAGMHNAAGIRVQSGGQLVAAGGDPGAQGVACNGHLNPINVDD